MVSDKFHSFFNIRVGGDGIWVGSNTTFLDGQWYHVAATYDEEFVAGQSKLTLYVDGNKVGSD